MFLLILYVSSSSLCFFFFFMFLLLLFISSISLFLLYHCFFYIIGFTKKTKRLNVNFFIKFSPKHSAKAPEAPRAPFKHPRPTGSRIMGLNSPKNLPPSRNTSLPNFIAICPAVWISIENRLTHTNRHSPLCIRRLAMVTQHCRW